MPAEHHHLAADTGAPATRVKSTASSIGEGYKYPNGHLGYLSLQQEDAFFKFKAVLEERGLYKPGPPPSHDDPLLL